MEAVNWHDIAEEYAATDISMNALSKKYAVPRTTLRDRAARERWSERREARRNTVSGGRGLPPVRKKQAEDPDALLRVTDKLLRRAEEIADNADEMGARELNELMRALKSASAIRQLHAAPESEDAALSIRFSPEAEEAAK